MRLPLTVTVAWPSLTHQVPNQLRLWIGDATSADVSVEVSLEATCDE